MTHNLKQYAIIYGTKCHLYKRDKPKRKQRYTSPRFVDKVWFRTKADALAFKAQYDTVF